MEQHITFTADGLTLEGLIKKSTSGKGVVIAHPHPLYGGDMYNPVVETIADAFGQKGYTTLKLNFRGVGRSQGNFDNGVGEQKDILGAVAYLEEQGTTQIDLSGYSFGAWTVSRLTDIPSSVQNIFLVSPPVGMMAFNPSPAMDRVKGIITGGSDDIAPAAEIKKFLSQIKSTAKLEIIPGADHFYWGHFHTVISTLMSMLP